MPQFAGERLDRLQRITAALSRLLEPHDVAEVILREVAPEFGGIGRAMWLVNAQGTHLELVAPDSHQRAAPFSAIPIDGDLPGAVVARTGEAIFISTRDERDERFPMLADVAPQVSIAVLPLGERDRVVGVIACSYDEEHAFSPEERNYLAALTALASQALDRSRLHSRQVEVARALQASLLPPALPAIAGVDLAAVYHPAWEGTEVGGDFYDVFPLPDGRGWVVTIGDVSGTGPEAAALTAQVRHTLRAVSRTGLDIDAALAVVNDTLAESLADERFCTMVVCRFEVGEQGVALWVVCAGHPAPIVVKAGGDARELAAGGPLVGAFAHTAFCGSAVCLDPGDALVLFTDGVTEARAASSGGGDRGFFGTERLIEAIGRAAGKPAGVVVDAVEAALMAYTGGRLADDVAVLVIRANP